MSGRRGEGGNLEDGELEGGDTDSSGGFEGFDAEYARHLQEEEGITKEQYDKILSSLKALRNAARGASSESEEEYIGEGAGEGEGVPGPSGAASGGGRKTRSVLKQAKKGETPKGGPGDKEGKMDFVEWKGDPLQSRLVFTQTTPTHRYNRHVFMTHYYSNYNIKL